GIVLLGLLRTPLRWSGAVLLLISVVWAIAVPQPDVLVSGDGHNVGVRGKDGRLHLMRTAKTDFSSRNGWAPTPPVASPQMLRSQRASHATSCICLYHVVSKAFEVMVENGL